jgi:hypothetical protein
MSSRTDRRTGGPERSKLFNVYLNLASHDTGNTSRYDKKTRSQNKAEQQLSQIGAAIGLYTEARKQHLEEAFNRAPQMLERGNNRADQYE